MKELKVQSTNPVSMQKVVQARIFLNGFYKKSQEMDRRLCTEDANAMTFFMRNEEEAKNMSEVIRQELKQVFEIAVEHLVGPLTKTLLLLFDDIYLLGHTTLPLSFKTVIEEEIGIFMYKLLNKYLRPINEDTPMTKEKDRIFLKHCSDKIEAGKNMASLLFGTQMTYTKGLSLQSMSGLESFFEVVLPNEKWTDTNDLKGMERTVTEGRRADAFIEAVIDILLSWRRLYSEKKIHLPSDEILNELRRRVIVLVDKIDMRMVYSYKNSPVFSLFLEDSVNALKKLEEELMSKQNFRKLRNQFYGTKYAGNQFLEMMSQIVSQPEELTQSSSSYGYQDIDDDYEEDEEEEVSVSRAKKAKKPKKDEKKQDKKKRSKKK